MTLSSLLADLYRRLGYTSSPASEVTVRLTAFLNETHRQILSHPALPSLRDDTVTFASTAGQSRYGLPPSVAMIEAVTDRTTQLRLTAMSLDELRWFDPGLLGTAWPTRYIPLGQQAVAIQPSSAAAIVLTSTAAGDTGTAYIEGFRTGGYPFSGSVTMTGTTPVTVSGSYSDVIEITKLYLSTAAVGTITCTMNTSGGTELARIAIGQTFSRYQGIQLWPTPNSAVTYYVDYMRVIPDLVNATDQPLLPEDFHWVLVDGALIREWQVKDDTRVGEARRSYAQGMNDLIYRVACPPDYLPAGTTRQERSRLGRWFKHGSGVR